VFSWLRSPGSHNCSRFGDSSARDNSARQFASRRGVLPPDTALQCGAKAVSRIPVEIVEITIAPKRLLLNTRKLCPDQCFLEWRSLLDSAPPERLRCCGHSADPAAGRVTGSRFVAMERRTLSGASHRAFCSARVTWVKFAARHAWMQFVILIPTRVRYPTFFPKIALFAVQYPVSHGAPLRDITQR
jgi:hypothetical protein